MYKTFAGSSLPFKNMVLLLAGAIPGALLRWQLHNDFYANIAGSALLGFIVSFQFGSALKVLLVIGFCGSLTTFSGWTLQMLGLIHDGFFLQAANVLTSTLFGGFLSLGLGFVIGKKINQSFMP